MGDSVNKIHHLGMSKKVKMIIKLFVDYMIFLNRPLKKV